MSSPCNQHMLVDFALLGSIFGRHFPAQMAGLLSPLTFLQMGPFTSRQSLDPAFLLLPILDHAEVRYPSNSDPE